MLLLAIEDWKYKSIRIWRSRLYESALMICILLDFIINWKLTFELAVCGIAFYLVAIPALSKLFKERYNYRFYEVDKEVFLITLVGFPFISLFAFLANQGANAIYNLLKRAMKSWSEEMPQLTIYGITWFLLAMAVLAFYVR
jgi:hypothetical protein